MKVEEYLGFSKESYSNLINLAREAGYIFTPFRNAFDFESRRMILRHDVDFSLACALELAQLENQLGVCSTYFVMVNCDYYNALSKKNRERIAQINELGHEIGLHWDSSNYPSNAKAIEKQFKNEVAILSDIIGKEVISAAQHIPTDSALLNVETYIQNEAYSDKYRKSFKYVSDSSMAWREKTPIDYIDELVNIHFNSHPLWWVAEGATRDEKLIDSVDFLANETRCGALEFTDYMNKILADRARTDAAFRARKGWQT